MSNKTQLNHIVKRILDETVLPSDINREGKYRGTFQKGMDMVQYTNALGRDLVVGEVISIYYRLKKLETKELSTLTWLEREMAKEPVDINAQRASDTLEGIRQAIAYNLSLAKDYDEALAFFTRKDDMTFESIMSETHERDRRNRLKKAKVVVDSKPLSKAQLSKLSTDYEPTRMPFGDNEASSSHGDDVSSHTSEVLNGDCNKNVEVQHSETIA